MVNWKRPLTLIYKDNHKFGSALYEPTLEECERRYTGSLGRTSFRSDRPDVSAFGESSAIGSSLRNTASTSRGTSRPKSVLDDLHEGRSLSRTRSTFDLDLDEPSYHSEDRGRSSRRQTSRQDSSSMRDLRPELEELQTRVAESERAARQDASALRDIMGSRMMELAAMVRDAEMHNEECQKIIRKQSQAMSDMQSYCAGLERKLADTIDELAATNNKVKSLYVQLESMRRD